MTRKLSGLWSALMANRAPLASLAVVGTLACTLAVAGCGGGGGKGGGNTADGGEGGTGEGGSTTACTTPAFSPVAGTVTAGALVTLTAPGLPANGFIYYTTDQTMPTHASKFVTPGGTVTVSQSETITAIAYAMGSCSDSAPASAAYEIADSGTNALPACAAPTFMPGAGAVAGGTSVTIVPPANFPASFPQGNGTVYYTVDGTIPSHASPAYSGPIQVNAAETIHAIASDPGVCTDSSVALAAYTLIPVEAGTLSIPAFNPLSQTEPNDFLVQLTDMDASATICFTFGAGVPTCTSNATSATCSGTSQTYNAGAGLGATGSVTINGGVSSAAGTVTVNAIACAPGSTTTAVATQTYTLKAAAPTAQGPAPGSLPYVAGGYAPTLASTTTGSTIRYTVDGSTPTCTTGTLLVANGAAANPGALPGFTTNSTFNAIACKTGYAPSPVGGPFVYSIVLPTPSFVDSVSSTTAEGTGTYDAAPTVKFDDGVADGVTGLFYCSTTDSSGPVCGAAGACTHGTAGPTLAVTATGTVVNVVACAPNETTSAGGTATYTLQLDPPGLDAPGCTETGAAGTSCVTAGPTTPILSYNIPATSAATFKPFIEESIGKLPASAGAQPTYQFVCVAKGATPGCTPTGCSAGSLISPVAAGDFKTASTVALAAAGVVVAGDSWSVIGCPGSTSPGFLASAVTTVGFALPGAAPSPVVSGGTGTGTYNSTVAPTFTNSGTAAEALCYGVYPVGTPPTTAVNCTAAGACGAVAGYGLNNGGTAGITLGVPAVTTVASIAVTAAGSGYTSTPTVTVDNPPAGPGALQAQATATVKFSVAVPAAPTTGGVGCSAATQTITFTNGGGTGATATVTINAANVVTGLAIKNPGTNYVTAPTTFTGLTCTTLPTFTTTLTNGVVTAVAVNNPGAGYLGTPNVVISGGGGTGATAAATLTVVPPQGVLPVLQTNNLDVDVVGCISGSPASTLKTYTYNFTESAPTVVDTTVGPTAAVVAGTTVALDDVLTLTAPSNFSAPAAPTVCYTTDGTAPNPACATAGTTTCVASGGTLTATAAAFTTNTLKAIACDPTLQTAQLNSAPYSAALSLVVGTPTPSVAGGTYFQIQNPTLASSTTSGAPVICYTTLAAATPTCNNTGCTGGTPTYTAAIPITSTGTVLRAIACEGAFTSAVSNNTYTYAVSPIILANTPALPLSYATTDCPGAIDVGLDCSEGSGGGTPGCSTATFNAGGATVGATVCYSTDGTAVTSCAPVANHITCGAAGTLHLPVNATQSIPVSINALACLAGFNSSAATLPVTVTPYSSAITFTGAPATDFVVAPTNEDSLPGSGGLTGYLSLTGTTVYVGLAGITPGATTDTIVYIGNGSTTNAATITSPAAPPIGANLNPAGGFQYAFQFPTTGTAGALYAWNNATTAWVLQGTAPTVTVGATMTTEEFSLPLSSLTQLGATPATITLAETEITGAGAVLWNYVGSVPTGAPPGGGTFTHWFAYPTGSCLYPNDAHSIH